MRSSGFLARLDAVLAAVTGMIRPLGAYSTPNWRINRALTDAFFAMLQRLCKIDT